MDGLVSEGIECLESAFGLCAVRVTSGADAILRMAANLDCFFIISLSATQGAKFLYLGGLEKVHSQFCLHKNPNSDLGVFGGTPDPFWVAVRLMNGRHVVVVWRAGSL